MDGSEIRRRMQALVDSDGPWTAHNIELADGVRTMDSTLEDPRLRRIVQAVADLAGKPLDTLRVLDLGCLEGQFAIEFALHGAEVVAVEGRELNLRKTRFAAECLGAERLDVRTGDVRRLDRESIGTFDVILCLGLLYHLDSPDVMELVASMAELCTGLLVIDTHISLNPAVSEQWRGNRYRGDYWTEYAEGKRADEEDEAVWSSIGNDRSFLLTRASLCNLLRHAGFTSVHECLNPYEYHSPDWPRAPADGRFAEWPDRSTFVAVKGRPVPLLTSPATDRAAERDRPEFPRYLQPVRPPRAPGFGDLAQLAKSFARRLLGRR